MVPRVLRGGSWNNNSDNARASYRNDNDSDWRNNNIGVRVVCVSHIVQVFNAGIARRPRLPAEAKALWMAQAGPVRTVARASARHVGRIEKRDASRAQAPRRPARPIGSG